MFSFPPFNRTVILLSAMLLMAALWDFLPHANFLMVCFTFLTSALLLDQPSFTERLKHALVMASYASTAQFIIAITANFPFGQLILAAAFGFFTFLTLPDHRAGCIVMITGYLALFAPPGFLPGVSRCLDIFCGVLVVMAVTALGNAARAKSKAPAVSVPFSFSEALELALLLGAGTFLFRALHLKQGPWIMLTMLFITMSRSPGNTAGKLAFQRIIAVPAGIILGGFLLGTFSIIDYRFVYLVPFIGAVGFWIFYNCGDFFLFSLIFMIALTIFSDWMAGPSQRYNFWEGFFSRSLSTLLGALPELFHGVFRSRKEQI